MDVEKLRSLTDAELLHQQQELNDQLFRLKFQLKMGQTESLNKIRGLRKDVARVHTVAREKQLGLVVESHHPAASAAGDATAAAKPAKKAAAGKGAKRKAKPAAPAKSKTAAAKGKKAKPAKKKTATAAKRKK